MHPVDDSGAVSARLLLVTDHQETRRQIARLLQDRFPGLEVTVAIDRREALALAPRAPFDVVIIDLQSMRGDAVSLALELRGVPVILLAPIGQEALAPADLPLAGASIVPTAELSARMPQAVAAALRRRARR